MSSLLRHTSLIATKEIVDNVRDRRTMTTALIVPLIGPLTLIAVFFAIKGAEEKTRTPHVPLIGRENAPELVQFLEHKGVIVEAPPADPESAVRDQKVDVVMRIPSDFGAHLREGTAANVEIICDPSRANTGPTLHRVEELVEGYGREIGALRLMLRGVDPQIMQATSVSKIVVSSPEAEKTLIIGSLPLFLLMSCFMAGLYITIDVTAGERERGTLEPLLLNPVSSTAIVLGKLLAGMVFAAAGVAVSLLAFAVMVPRIPFADIGLDIHIPARVVVGYVLLFLPTVVLATSVQLFVGTLSKNVKAAQASLGFIIIAPMIPSIILSLFPQQPSVLLCAIPTVGESILALRILRNEHIELVHWLVNAVADLTIAGVLIVVTARLFGPRMLSG